MSAGWITYRERYRFRNPKHRGSRLQFQVLWYGMHVGKIMVAIQCAHAVLPVPVGIAGGMTLGTNRVIWQPGKIPTAGGLRVRTESVAEQNPSGRVKAISW